MNFSLEFLPEAKLEMKEIFQCYEERKEGLGDDFTAEVEKELDRILDSPTSVCVRNSDSRKGSATHGIIR